VMIGQPSRYLHKLAGPFDAILQDGMSADALLHDRIVGLLPPSGTLVTSSVASAGKYNEVLNRDARLNTVVLNIAGGVALSVRRRS
jgi:hypothetical protein